MPSDCLYFQMVFKLDLSHERKVNMEKKKLLNLVGAGLFLVALVLLLVLPALVSSKGGDPIPFLGVTFGAENKFKFSFLNLLTPILLVLGLVLALLRGLGKSLIKSNVEGFIVLGLGVLGLVFIVLTKTFVVYDNALVEAAVTNGGYGLSVGAIIAMVLAVLGGGAAVAGDYLK